MDSSRTALHERLQMAAGGRSYRQIAELTGTNHETVRRYMTGQAPSAEFLGAVCRALRISADWLLIGRGAMHAEEARRAALRESSAPDLLSAVAEAIEELLERVDRVEVYVHTLETRVRAQPGPTGGTHGSQTPDPGRERARRIADALPGRPSPDHHRPPPPGGA